MPPGRHHIHPSLRRHCPAVVNEVSPIVHLWLLRLLVPLNAQQSAISHRGFNDDGLAALLGLGRWTESEQESFDIKTVRLELRKFHAAAERDISKASVPDRLSTNVARLAELVDLNATDCRVLEFAVMLNSERVLDDMADHLGQLSTLKVCQVLAIVLGLPQASVRASLDGQGVLSRSGFLSIERRGSSTLRGKLSFLSDQFADRLATLNADPISLLRDTVLPSSPGHLSLTDFEHLNASLDLLRPYLRRALAERRSGVNVLLHGSPGTGKNQLAKAIAAELRCELYEVSSEDGDGDPIGGVGRLRAYRAAQSVLSQTRGLILFDEVQDVFEAADRHSPYGGATAQGKKAWINRMLEGNPVPALWLTNSIAEVDPAFIRRFDMVLELPVPPRRQREKIVREACGDLLDAHSVAQLADCEALAPAVVARAASVVRFVGSELGLGAAGEAVRRLIHQTVRAQGHTGLLRSNPLDLPQTYDPTFLHADADLGEVARGLATAESGRLCLYGPPGSGKTAWARWLAVQLGRPLLVRRASDLMSKWLGDNEKNIAAAFRQAEADGAVLLIDEVDTFLQDRRGADRPWEVSLVNEMLTQMESFAGLFIASTNLMDGLDAAALRRFDLKIRFDYLRPAQAWALLERQVAVLGLAPPEPELRQPLSRLGRLTPGDFATVARQHRFRPLQTAADLLRALEAEVGLKRQGAALPIGFV